MAIIRISNPSPGEFFERFAARGLPVIVTDVMHSWKCRTLWSDEYLTTKLKNRSFLVNKSSNGAFGIYSSRMRDIDNFIQVGFAELLVLMYGPKKHPGNETYYMQQKTIQETFPELVDDLDYACFFDRARIRDVNVWFSQSGGNIPLHFDTFDNLLAQVRGSKKIKLFAPQQSPFLYPGRDGADFASQVDIDNPDLDRFPLSAKAQAYMEFSLAEGEILYLPAYWWHHVTTESAVSLSINYWYHLVYGHPRDRFLTVRELLRIGLHYLSDLPSAQKELAIQQCRQTLDQHSESHEGI